MFLYHSILKMGEMKNKKVLLADLCVMINLYSGNPSSPPFERFHQHWKHRKADCKAKPLQHGQKTCAFYKREGESERACESKRDCFRFRAVTHSVSNRGGDRTLYTPSYTHKSRAHLSQFTLARQTLPTPGSTGQILLNKHIKTIQHVHGRGNTRLRFHHTEKT